MTRQELRENLTAIMDTDYILPDGENMDEYLDAMVEHIGDLDILLRDELIYMAFYKWIEEKELVSEEKMIEIFNTLLSDDYLFYNIDKTDDTSVYTRTFSLLVFNPILTVHEKKHFLSDEDINKYKDKMIDYLNREKDFRGYTEHGWAHAFAHWADLTYFFTFDLDDKNHMAKSVLDLILDKYLSINIPLTREEDERLSTNIASHYIKGNIISLEAFKTWLSRFEEFSHIEGSVPQSTVRVNLKHLLRSLYFRLVYLKADQGYLQAVSETEIKLNRFSR